MIAILLLLLGPAPQAHPVRATSGCSNPPINGGFENAGNPWTESSTNGLKIVCTPGTCGTGGGTVGPRNGITWAWLGGISAVQEIGSVSHAVTIPLGTAELSFFLWIGASSGNGQDRSYRRWQGV